MVATKGSLRSAQQLHEIYDQKGQLEVHYGDKYEVDEDQIKSTYQKVVTIINQEAPEKGLTTSDLIADITGGLKPMSVGMALLLARQCDMQYMKSLRDISGELVADVNPNPYRSTRSLFRKMIFGGDNCVSNCCWL